jgi:hypothetical protein
VGTAHAHAVRAHVPHAATDRVDGRWPYRYSGIVNEPVSGRTPLVELRDRLPT